MIVLDGGRIIADGPPRDVLTETLMRQVYGVEIHRIDNGGGLIVLPSTLSETNDA